MLNNFGGFKMVESANAIDTTEIVGKMPKYIKRTWKERLFTLPWKSLKKYELIMVPEYKPCMYRMYDRIIYHPSFRGEMKGLLNDNQDN